MKYTPEAAVRRYNCKRAEKQRLQAGFTLVELIVVLVILAILAAIMIPALSGWIQKAKEKRYIMEARSCVQAADARAFELYGMGNLSATSFLSNEETEILALAGLPSGADILDGSLAFIGGGTDPKPPVERLTYVSADGVRVKYDRSGNPVYELDAVSSAPGAPTYALDWNNKIQSALGTDALPLHNVNTGKLTEYIESVNGGTLPSLTTSEKALLSPAGVAGYSGVDGLTWKPVQVKEAANLGSDNGYLLIASSSGINAALIYYNNSYYMCLNKVYNGTVKADYASVNASFSLSSLTNAPSLSSVDLDGMSSGKTWVRCD